MVFEDTGYILEEPKPPPILLWIIAVTTCLLFVASAVLIAIGAVYAYGMIGMVLVGCGAVLYLATVIGLFVSCIKLQRRYPGRRLIPSRLMPGRNVRRLSILENPHTSGSAPGKTEKGQKHQGSTQAPTPKGKQVQQESMPETTNQNSEDSPTREATPRTNLDHTYEDPMAGGPHNTHQEGSSSGDPRSGELEISADSPTLRDGEFQSDQKPAVPPPSTDPQQEEQYTASTTTVPGHEKSTLVQMPDPNYLESLPGAVCTTDIASPLPSEPPAVEAPVPSNNQDQQREQTSLQCPQREDSKAQNSREPGSNPQQGISLCDVQDRSLTPKDSDTSPGQAPSSDCTTESNQAQHPCPQDTLTTSSCSHDHASLSTASALGDLKPKSKQEKEHEPDGTPQAELRHLDVNPSLPEFPTVIVNSTPSHKQHPDHENSLCKDPRSGVLTTTLSNAPCGKYFHISNQDQNQCEDDAPPKVLGTANFASMTLESPASCRKQVSPDQLNHHSHGVPTTAVGVTVRIPDDVSSDEMLPTNQKPQPEHCDNITPKGLHYRDAHSTMLPSVPNRQRHASFYAETMQSEIVAHQEQWHDNSSPKALHTVNFASKTPASPASYMKQVSPHQLDHHSQDVPTTGLGVTLRMPGVISNNEIHLENQKQQPEHCDYIIHSGSRYRDIPSRMLPSLPNHRRQPSFHEEPTQSEMVSHQYRWHADSTPSDIQSVNFASKIPASSASYVKQVSPQQLDHQSQDIPTTAIGSMMRGSGVFSSEEAHLANQKPQPEYYDDITPSGSHYRDLPSTMLPSLANHRRQPSFHVEPSQSETVSRQYQWLDESTPSDIQSVNFSRKTPASSASYMKQVSPQQLDHQSQDIPTTAIGSTMRSPGVFSSEETHLANQKLQPEHYDDITPSDSHYRDFPSTMLPSLTNHRRQPSFHGQAMQSDILPAIGMYATDTTSALTPFPPSHRKYLSDHEQDQQHQGDCGRNPRPRDSTWEPDTSSPSYRKLRSHRGQRQQFKDLPPPPTLHSTELGKAHAVPDPNSRLITSRPRHYQYNPYESTVEPRYSDYIPSRLAALPRSVSAAGSHPRHYPQHPGMAVRSPPSRHFGSSAAASGPSQGRPISYPRQHQRY